MINYVQFFPDYTEYSTDSLSHKEGSLGIFQVSYNPAYQDAILADGSVQVIDTQSPPPETTEAKRNRKMEEFISAISIEGFDWEDVVLGINDYSQLITIRDFGGDSGAQAAMSAKTDMKHLALFRSMGVPIATIRAVYADEITKIEAISRTRVALGLSPFNLSFLND